ncbi:glycoside hydrolase family 16 protein [Hypholoma sublateritium FD-334 SS-4]|uniref:Glycoside hydrolase family 16 protein n=1 Tax=Hypholoma sublateritium (strain FD-334 SS-4) TaxID=945553 RepID=A0A0D2MHJ2_HYPSF|nr:glycoside hydrolase family 16 protein [Hypholoma sublateritium FD-334 SS-4]
MSRNHFQVRPTSPSTTGLLTGGASIASSRHHRTPSDLSSVPGTPVSPFSGGRSDTGHPPSLSGKYALSPSPAQWGMPLLLNAENREPDDILHNPDPRNDGRINGRGSVITLRGLANLGCLLILALGIFALFACLPIYTHFTQTTQTNQGGFNLGGTNGTGQIPDLPGNFQLIDKDTPSSAYTYKAYEGGDEMELIFSDEFNADGRSFYPGDDPFWEAVDLHYWGTNDEEWYDPAQVTTKGGNLRITLDQVDDLSLNHNMTYKSGMIQTWNKFCFTGGLLVASVQLPGSSDVSGFWPGVWSMGNLGRAGYGASVEGLWPYSYDSCDVGTLPNQTYPGTATPIAAMVNGDGEANGELSYLTGQRLSACTCPGESHPGPMREDGSYVGRAAPEIDILEATVTDGVGYGSLSAQLAPFNAKYTPYMGTADNTTIVIYDANRTVLNTYQGGRYQQTISGLGLTNPNCYERPGTCFALYGFEYRPGFDNAYITWINEVRSWTLYSSALVADSAVEISQRLIPVEPMYIITNLGISEGFGLIDTANLVFPATMLVDYIRLYQRKGETNVGCNPDDFPTAAYIDTYKEVYSNPNLTVWADYKQPWPKNRLSATGCT